MIKFGSNVKTKPPKSIVGLHSAGGAQFTGSAAVASLGKNLLSGTLTANVYSALLTVTGSGCLYLCYTYANDGTSRTMGLKIEIDGTSVFDAVSNACTTQYNGVIGVGAYVNNATILPVPTVFNSSLIISLKSSVAASEDNKMTLVYAYETR